MSEPDGPSAKPWMLVLGAVRLGSEYRPDAGLQHLAGH